MKIEIKEDDLIFLLQRADSAANTDVMERGEYEHAHKTRKFVEEMIRKINKTAGYKKWTYNEMFGVRQCKYDDGDDDNDKEV